MFVFERIDERRSRSVVKRDGKIAQITDRTLSEFGKTLTVVRKYPDGRTNAILIWERRKTSIPKQDQ